MGNNQSNTNTRTDWRMLRITEKAVNIRSNWIKFRLNGDVNYKDRERENYIYCANNDPYVDYQVNDYLLIDFECTRLFESGH